MSKIMILALGRANAGCGLYAREIIKRIKAKDIVIYKSKFSNIDWQNITNKGVMLKNIITFHNKFEFILSTIFIYPVLCLTIFFKLLFKKFDVLYIPYFNPWEYLIIKLFRLFNKRVVYTVHDGLMHIGEQEFVQQRLQYLAIVSATDVIFLTNYVKKIISTTLKFKADTYVVQHGILSLDGVYRCKQKKEKAQVLFLGRVSKYKGVEILVDALSLLDYSCIDKVVIAGKSNYSISYPTHQKLVIIDKWLSESEIVNLLNKSDIIVLPYIEASQSGIVTLAIDTQTPMICTDVGGFREQVGDAAVFIEPNPLSLANALNSLASNVEHFNNLQYNLSLRGEQLKWDNITKEIEDIIIKDKSCAE